MGGKGSSGCGPAAQRKRLGQIFGTSPRSAAPHPRPLGARGSAARSRRHARAEPVRAGARGPAQARGPAPEIKRYFLRPSFCHGVLNRRVLYVACTDSIYPAEHIWELELRPMNIRGLNTRPRGHFRHLPAHPVFNRHIDYIDLTILLWMDGCPASADRLLRIIVHACHNIRVMGR